MNGKNKRRNAKYILNALDDILEKNEYRFYIDEIVNMKKLLSNAIEEREMMKIEWIKSVRKVYELSFYIEDRLSQIRLSKFEKVNLYDGKNLKPKEVER